MNVCRGGYAREDCYMYFLVFCMIGTNVNRFSGIITM